MPRPKIVGQTHGLVKVVVDATSDLILGAALHTIDAQELINLVALAMRTDTTAAQLRDGIWTHPSSTEALNEVRGARSVMLRCRSGELLRERSLQKRLLATAQGPIEAQFLGDGHLGPRHQGHATRNPRRATLIGDAAQCSAQLLVR